MGIVPYIASVLSNHMVNVTFYTLSLHIHFVIANTSSFPGVTWPMLCPIHYIQFIYLFGVMTVSMRQMLCLGPACTTGLLIFCFYVIPWWLQYFSNLFETAIKKVIKQFINSNFCCIRWVKLPRTPQSWYPWQQGNYFISLYVWIVWIWVSRIAWWINAYL